MLSISKAGGDLNGKFELFWYEVMVHGIWYILGFESHLRTKLIVAKHKSLVRVLYKVVSVLFEVINLTEAGEREGVC